MEIFYLLSVFGLWGLVVIVGVAIYLRRYMYYVPNGWCMVVSNRGHHRVLNTGYHLLNPLYDQIRTFHWTYPSSSSSDEEEEKDSVMEGHLIPLNNFQVDPPLVDFYTKESIKVDLDFNLVMRVSDPILAMITIDNPLQLFITELDSVVSQIVCNSPYEQFLKERASLTTQIFEQLRHFHERYGIQCCKLTIEHIEIDEEYQKTLRAGKLAEAEATLRSARMREEGILARERHAADMTVEQEKADFQTKRAQNDHHLRMLEQNNELQYQKALLEKAEVEAAIQRSKQDQESYSTVLRLRTVAQYFRELLGMGFGPKEIVALETNPKLCEALLTNTSKLVVPLPSNIVDNFYLGASDNNNNNNNSSSSSSSSSSPVFVPTILPRSSSPLHPSCSS